MRVRVDDEELGRLWLEAHYLSTVAVTFDPCILVQLHVNVAFVKVLVSLGFVRAMSKESITPGSPFSMG
jgi:hypothetical protein